MDRDEIVRVLRAFEAATPAALYRLKRDTVRPIDLVMPVQRFRSVADMNAAPVPTRGGQQGFERFLRHCTRVRKLAPLRHRPGVVRFRSVQEADAARSAPR